MLIIDELFNDKLEKGTYIALGSFDGLHLGHMSLVNSAIEMAKENNGLSMVYTFKNHPLTVVKGKTAPKLLNNNPYKLQLLEEAGIDVACLVTFDEEYMQTSAEDFIKMLIDLYNAKGFIVGFNYKFGYRNTGNVELLKKLQPVYKYKLKIMEPLKFDQEVVSSSRIREALQIGKVEEASTLLNRPYCLSNIVIHGKKLGRKLGYPTANLNIDLKYVIPANGIYYTNVKVKDRIYKGITSVGTNPTVESKGLSIETFILDFNEEIYGEEISIFFIKKIRDEIKFNSLEDLSKRLSLDEIFAEKEEIHPSLMKK